MGSLGQFSSTFLAGVDAGMPDPKRMRSALGSRVVPQNPMMESLASDFASATAMVAGVNGIPTLNTPSSQGTSGDLPITDRLATVLFTSDADYSYADYLDRAFVFSVFDAGDGVVRMVHLNILNAKLRDDWNAYVRQVKATKRPAISPADIGVGSKRSITMVDAQRIRVDSNTGLITMEQVAEHVLFLGMVLAADNQHKGKPNLPNKRGTLESMQTIQYAGIMRDVSNVFGKVNVGDHLSFHVLRINSLNEGSVINSIEDYGPIQVVPVVSSTKNAAFMTGSGAHFAWQTIRDMARSPANGFIPASFGTTEYNPFLTRVGLSNSNAFSMVRPIRDLTPDRNPGAAHWGFVREAIKDESGRTSLTMLYTSLTPNLIFTIGTVHRVHPSVLNGPTKAKRKEMLLQPSGRDMCDLNNARIDVIVESTM